MHEQAPITPGIPPRANAASTPPAGAASAGTSGAAFQALIEKLGSQAQALEQDAASVRGPDDLAGAVDRAHASLQDALSLSDRLLEAYRESRQRAAGPGSRP